MPYGPIPIGMDGSGNCKVSFSLGAVDISTGFTLMVLQKWNSLADYNAGLQVVTSTPTDCVSIEASPGGPTPVLSVDAVEYTFAGIASISTGVWFLIGATKASGSAAPRGHRYNFDTSTWSHANSASSVADSARTEATIQIGEWINTDPLNGYFAGAAIWGDPLTDPQVESLTANFNTWVNLGPQWMVVGNGATAMVDEVGSGNESSRESGVTAAPGQTSPLTWVATGAPVPTARVGRGAGW